MAIESSLIYPLKTGDFQQLCKRLPKANHEHENLTEV